MPPLRVLDRPLVAIALFAALARAPAATAHDGLAGGESALRWGCWYDGGEGVVCVLLAAPPRQQAAQRVVSAPSGSLRRASLPPIVREMREDPGRLRAQLLRVPMHTIPTDLAFARELAGAVMCGTRADCVVLWRDAPDADLLIEAGWDD